VPSGTPNSWTAWRCGHALVNDSGWREVADTALAFVKRFV
jgi:hypothetical protein